MQEDSLFLKSVENLAQEKDFSGGKSKVWCFEVNLNITVWQPSCHCIKYMDKIHKTELPASQPKTNQIRVKRKDDV